MSERYALMRAILLFPQDDTPRLVFADYLDENGETERAEFIRVQCELHGLSCNQKGMWSTCSYFTPCPTCQRIDKLRSRERDLFNAHGAEWFGANATLTPPNRAEQLSLGVFIVPVRGFQSHWYGPWGKWASEECDRCQGRGFAVRLSLTGDSDCPSCNRSGRIPGASVSQAWRPTWEMECGRCEGRGEERYCDAAGDMDDRPCKDCGGGYQNGYRRGSGRVPRPCPPGAVPLTDVTLTTMPDTMDLFKLSQKHGFGESPGNRLERHLEIISVEWPGLAFNLPSVQ